MDQPATTRLSGWGLNLRSDCVLREPELPGEVSSWMDRAGTIARGLGRSYGDAALNAGGQVLGLHRLDRYISFDAATGVLACEAGATLEQIIADFAPRGWFPMVTPGTKFVTVGGCIASSNRGSRTIVTSFGGTSTWGRLVFGRGITASDAGEGGRAASAAIAG